MIQDRSNLWALGLAVVKALALVLVLVLTLVLALVMALVVVRGCSWEVEWATA
eukprot:CAMPEP_0171728574 /NCGR_PEP_ID=MMETSP0991-20121206/27055_1 /TAXON_ID=483369 /ORGANISM="non described non described, Strain CCMP2098" /LENGTH=52 /DNA_ID=CAMNT_0012322699 /DNA_START=60 /DNA_END=214 /DNA_ORIENTATION=+